MNTLIVVLMGAMTLNSLPAELPENQTDPSAKEIVTSMLDAMNGGESYRFTMKSYERMDGEMNYTRISVKLNVDPFKIYIISHEEPNAGAEVLYIDGENNGKAVVKKKGLPTWKLSPFAKKIRKEGHHTILDAGFEMMADIVGQAVEDAGDQFDEVFEHTGNIKYNNIPCYKIEVTDPDWGWVSYTIKEGESLYDIAHERNICERLIVEKNDNLNNYSSGSAGDVIQIPTSYAKKSIFYVDMETYHPIYQEIHDETEVFQKYIFTELEVDASINSDEFTKDYSDYNF